MKAMKYFMAAASGRLRRWTVVAGAGVISVGAAGAEEQAAEPEGRQLYSDDEIAREYRKAREHAPQTRATEEAGEEDEEIVELEPVRVVSDDARIVRRIDEAMGQRLRTLMDPQNMRILTRANVEMIWQAEHDLRASQRFFDEREPRIGPADVPDTGGVSAGELADAVRSAADAVTGEE